MLNKKVIFAFFVAIFVATPNILWAKTTTYGVFKYQNDKLLITDIQNKKSLTVPTQIEYTEGTQPRDVVGETLGILRKGAIKVSKATLDKIPLVNKPTTSGVKFAAKYSGKLLKLSDKDSRVWFVDPKTKTRHYYEASLGSYMYFLSYITSKVNPVQQQAANTTNQNNYQISIAPDKTVYAVGESPSISFKIKYQGPGLAKSFVINSDTLNGSTEMKRYHDGNTILNTGETKEFLLVDTSLKQPGTYTVASRVYSCEDIQKSFSLSADECKPQMREDEEYYRQILGKMEGKEQATNKITIEVK